MKGSRGLGWVYRRGRVWWVQVRMPGGRYRESSKSEVRSDAVKLLRKRLGEISRGQAPASTPEKVMLEDLFEMLHDDYVVNDRKSLDRSQASVKHVRECFGNPRAIDITLDRLNGYVKLRREKGAAPSTVRNEMAALKRAFNLAVRAGRLTQRPPFPKIEVRNTRTGFFEPEQFAAVLENLPEAVKPVAQFMYLTGWRRGEVVTLQWRQVDFGAGCVRLEPGSTKNDDGRTFPFVAFPDLMAILEAQRERTREMEKATHQIIPWVFHRNGRPMRNFRTSWKSACEAAGVAGRIPHDFRRTAVRNLERAGVPRSVAMQLTGHKTESIYRRYAIVSEADLAEGVQKLSRLHEAQQHCLAFTKTEPVVSRRRGGRNPRKR